MSTEGTPEREWTEAQRLGITTVGKSVLVSAAAGSGKTTVLAERFVHLVCDATETCDAAQLLVVTFTEPAAAEMKSRIGRALSRRHAKLPSPHTTRQLALIDRANIGTLHGFCSRLLRQHFNRVGLDPDFLILDGDEASLLKRETARTLFEDRYEDDAGDSFREFVDSYGDGKDERLVGLIVRAHDTLGSMLDPADWARAARKQIITGLELPLNQSTFGAAYLQEIHRALSTLAAEANSAIAFIKTLGSFPKYIDRLNECAQIIRLWQEFVDAGRLDDLASEAATLQFDRMTAVSSSIPNKDQAKAAMDAVVESLKNGRWRASLRFTEADWHDGLQRVLPHVDTFLSLVSQFTLQYDDAKRRQNTLDFADLEQFALRVLRDDGPGLKPSTIARAYHKHFKHVLVDEYQDINQVQDAILCLISRECLHVPGAKTPTVTNLFCVGDVKQSIYRFRLAEPMQFIQRRTRYQAAGANGKVIDLQENFRSRGPLLEAINAVFERMMTRAAVDLEYDQSQRLYGRRAFPPAVTDAFTGGPIELHLVPKDPASAAENDDENDDADPEDRTSHEASVLARRIQEVVGAAGQPRAQVVDRVTGQHRPARFGDIVVLLRSMKFKSDAFADALRSAGIPVHTESATGYFEATEINDLLSLLQVLDNRAQDIPLAALLRSPLLGLPDPDAAMLTIGLSAYDKLPAGGGSPDNAETGASAPGYQGKIAFHEAVIRYAKKGTDALATQLRDIFATLDRWRDVARQRPVAELVWLVLQETRYLAYVAGQSNGRQRQANVLELYDRAGQFGTFRRQGLSRFLEFLEKLKAESDLGQASIASPADDVVRIMSIHRSKGLEFPIVCVPDLGKAINLSDCRGSVLLDRELGLGLEVVDLERMVRYPSLASKVIATRLRQQTLAEEMRVLYVAMTRAEEHLILIGTCTPTQADRWTQRWATHAGALPVEAILDARSILDWLGPAAVATSTAKTPPIEIIRHDDTDAPPDAIEADATDSKAARLADLAALRPTAPPPAMDADARAVIDRLTRHYAFEKLDHTPASLSVTAITHGAHRVAAATVDPIDRALSLPPLVSSDRPLSAADRGTATHTVLEHLNFAHAKDANAVRSQIQKMLQQNRLTPTEAAAVDVDAIEWFLRSGVGALVRDSAGSVLRELPLYLAHIPDRMAGTPLAPMDHIMVRGRIDLLVPDGDGYAIVDYKTDRVEGEALQRRTEEYARQLDLYRKAILKITRKQVTRAVLVFLTAREIREIEAR